VRSSACPTHLVSVLLIQRLTHHEEHEVHEGFGPMDSKLCVLRNLRGEIFCTIQQPQLI
jgi:hypothetical protein